MSRRQFISVRALGFGEEDRQPDLQVVVLSFYRPRGGSRAAEVISRDDAIQLRDELNRMLP